jgi:hypothetical protein|tara:strand:+ start:353 stop:664 length:312 start_codon:yes stop_codon:yes gene_type:complete
MDGVYTQEFMFEEFKQIKSRPKKVAWLTDMKSARISHPELFRGTRITIKHFDKLIEVWSQKNPRKYAEDLIGITARVEKERAAEKEKQSGGKPVFSGRGPNAK